MWQIYTLNVLTLNWTRGTFSRLEHSGNFAQSWLGKWTDPIAQYSSTHSPVEYQPRTSRPCKIVDPPKLFGERKFIDNVLEKEDRVTEVILLDEPQASSMVSFIYNSPSDFLTPLVEFPTRLNLVSETTLSWSS